MSTQMYGAMYVGRYKVRECIDNNEFVKVYSI